MRAIIIEDEQYIRKGLVAMINSLKKGITILGECESVKEAITVTKACKPDLVFLDINLIDGTAFDFLNKLEQINFKIIFITAYDQYSLQALKNGAIDYILKPVDVEELEQAINKAIGLQKNDSIEQVKVVEEQLLNNKKTRLVLRLQEGFQIIEFKDLMYCKSDKRHTTFYLENGKSYIASKPLKEFEPSMPSNSFFRTHQSFILNLSFVNKYEKSGYAYLKSGEKIPVSSRNKEAFINKIFEVTI